MKRSVPLHLLNMRDRVLPNAPNIPNCRLLLKLARYRVSRALEASLIILGKSAITHSKVSQSSPNPKNIEERKNSLGQFTKDN